MPNFDLNLKPKIMKKLLLILFVPLLMIGQEVEKPITTTITTVVTAVTIKPSIFTRKT